jgi:protoporphyrinogen oxidase
MNEVIVIGGGLTGLSAARALQAMGVSHTLIEVKPRPGGSIQTVRRDGFVADGAAFISEKTGPWPWLGDVGLSETDDLIDMGPYRHGRLVAFRDGTATLIDRLAAGLTATIMMRMAVSSLGMLDAGRYGVCLENGLMLEARGVVIAAPARFAEHMLRALSPEAALRLLDVRYDPTVRISIGLRADDAALFDDRDSLARRLTGLSVSALAMDSWEMLPTRIPPGHALLRVHVRAADAATAQTMPGAVLQALDIRHPAFVWAHFWPEADHLMDRLPEHLANITAIRSLLPDRIAIAGSDYGARRLDERVADGISAARRATG